MNNQRDIQIFELANRLINLDVATLSEQQLQHRNDMILKLKEEIKMLDEASLAQMRDYFKATDPKVRSVSPTAKYVANTDPNAQANMQKRFRSQAEYEEWLEKNGLKQISGIKKEGIADTEDAGEYDQEGDMARQDLATASNAAEELRSILDSDENLPEWVQSKITKAVDYLDTVRDYMKSKDQDVTEGNDHSLKKVWDRYSKHLAASRGDHSDVTQIHKSGEITRNIRKYVKDHHGQKAVDDMERYADRRQWNEGMAEASQRVDSLVTDTLRIMKGPEVNDAVSALKTVLGDREYNGRRGHYNFYVRQIIDMYNQQGVTEAKKPSPKLTAVDIKKTAPVSEEINTEAYERLQKVFAFKNYES